MQLVQNFAILIFSFFFILGFFCKVISGSSKAVKYCLGIIGALFFVGALIGLALSNGFLIFVLPQIVVLAIVFIMVTVVGALFGGFVQKLMKKSASTSKISTHNFSDYLPIAEFSVSKALQEEKVIQRIKSGFYQGGQFEGRWYVHQSEL
jgi:hypothetical protein